MFDHCKDSWDAKYIDEMWESDRIVLYNVSYAANYMDIKCLLSLCCCKIGTVIKGEPAHKIKSLLIPLDKTTELETTE
jgi:hypothetical protein